MINSYDTLVTHGSQLDIRRHHYFLQPWLYNFVHHCLDDLKEIIQKLNLLSKKNQQWEGSGAVLTRVKI